MEAITRFNNNPILNYQKDSTDSILDPTNDDLCENGEIIETLINENEEISDFGVDSEEMDSDSEETDSEC